MQLDSRCGSKQVCRRGSHDDEALSCHIVLSLSPGTALQLPEGGPATDAHTHKVNLLIMFSSLVETPRSNTSAGETEGQLMEMRIPFWHGVPLHQNVLNQGALQRTLAPFGWYGVGVSTGALLIVASTDYYLPTVILSLRFSLSNTEEGTQCFNGELCSISHPNGSHYTASNRSRQQVQNTKSAPQWRLNHSDSDGLWSWHSSAVAWLWAFAVDSFPNGLRRAPAKEQAGNEWMVSIRQNGRR